MNCNFCQESLELYILGELDPSVARGVSDHLESGCAVCNGEMRAINDSLECLIESTEMISPRGATWDQVAAAIASDRSPMEATASLNERDPSYDGGFRPVVLGLLATACGFLITMFALRATIDRSIPTSVTFDERGTSGSNEPNSGKTDWAVDPASRDQGENFTQLVSFHEPNQSRHVAGGMVVDVDGAQIHVHVKMSDPRGYSLWFITEEDHWIFGGKLERLDGDHYGSILDIPETDEPIVHAVIAVGQSDETDSAGRDIALVSDSVGDLSPRSL